MSTQILDEVKNEVGGSEAPVAAPQRNPQEEMYTAATRVFDGGIFTPGTVAAQGDFYIFRLGKMPTGAKVSERRRLGTDDTPGSRHDVTVGEMFTAAPDAIRKAMKAAIKEHAPGMVNRIDPDKVIDECFGPIFTTTLKDGKEMAVLEHPEHGHHVYEGEKMIFCSIAQRTLDSLQKIARMRD